MNEAKKQVTNVTHATQAIECIRKMYVHVDLLNIALMDLLEGYDGKDYETLHSFYMRLTTYHEMDSIIEKLEEIVKGNEDE